MNQSFINTATKKVFFVRVAVAAVRFFLDFFFAIRGLVFFRPDIVLHVQSHLFEA